MNQPNIELMLGIEPRPTRSEQEKAIAKLKREVTRLKKLSVNQWLADKLETQDKIAELKREINKLLISLN